ncbi:unnamed protein product [Rotaria sordida]|uniref:G-protein coupled receptors family 1 profile domain-containing protein n=1 Tax=Rotaria sordida TaxID=392033 RepID=A0A814PWX2_9BILA|nr:unnamed protein product [Rotaria sordida]CAF1102859.1 unnamed protein product [Rotaria sordida]CAF1111577.1 unnamed protein product [Rotaria sordida]CAF1168710.1 unnamed protein product [Rotaria sordida]CAF1422241.1 unnamed protein product [Rotaria sordida]
MSATSISSAIGMYGYVVTFSLGLIGHSCSLLTFSQRQLRSTSTTLLFFNITIFDMLYLFMSLYDFFLINLGLPQLSPYYISLCRFRTFIINFVQTISPWLLVFIAFDRVIRARLPHRTKQLCTKKNVIIILLMTILCTIAFNSHVLQSSFTVAFPFSHVICGPSHENLTDYGIFYYFTWPVLQIWINILIPALLMIACLIIVYQKVRSVAMVRHNQQLQNQMILLMLSKIILFLICTLPYGTYRMLTIYLVDEQNVTKYYTFFIITAVLTIFLNANFSLAFYIHCLTSTLFRQTFFNTIKNCIRQRRRQATVQPAVCTIAPK